MVISILEDKIQLAKMVLDIEDESIIEQVKSFLLINMEDEKVDSLPPFVKQGLKESLEQANAGEFISYQDVFKEVDSLLRK